MKIKKFINTKTKVISILLIVAVAITGVAIGVNANNNIKVAEKQKTTQSVEDKDKTKESKKDNKSKQESKQKSDKSVSESTSTSKSNNGNSNKTTQKSYSSISGSSGESISKGRTVYPVNYTPTIKSPSSSSFGKYYNNAMTCYDYFANDGSSKVTLTFDSLSDLQNFEKKFNSECLGETGLELNFTYRIGGSNEATAKNIITQFEHFKTNAELDKLIVSIIGSGVSEYTAIQRLNNWLINNTSYDYSGNDVAASTASAILYNRKAIDAWVASMKNKQPG